MTTEHRTQRPEATPRPLGNVLLTGGASGLGAAAADAVYAAGGRPIVVDVVEPDADYESIVVDLSDTDATSSAIRRRAERGVDAVVTAAGIDVPGPLVDLDAHVWERIVRVNLFGTVAVIRAALPSL